MSGPAALEKRLGHRFGNSALLEQALTHRSCGPQNNERLEFLGDGVLGCAIAQGLYARFPQLPEGKLTQLRADLVRKETLAKVGADLHIAEFLRIGSGGAITESVLADAVEAIFGAIFVDAGYEAALRSVATVFEPFFGRIDPRTVLKDAKTHLQEIMQANGKKIPKYQIISHTEAARGNSFEVQCVLPDLDLSTRGSGTSRQRAEQQAALAMLEKLEKAGA